MTLLIIGIAVFLGIHLLPTVGGWREKLIGRLGLNGYKVLFSLLSVLSVAFLRGPLLRRIMPVRREGLAVDSLVGEVAVPLEDLAPGAVGKAELRGSAWTAKNVDARPLARGERSIVAQVDGLVLSLRGQ